MTACATMTLRSNASISPKSAQLECGRKALIGFGALSILQFLSRLPNQKKVVV